MVLSLGQSSIMHLPPKQSANLTASTLASILAPPQRVLRRIYRR